MSPTNTIVPLGKLVVTASISEMINKSPDFSLWITKCINRHRKGDWGECCEEDKDYNDSALHWDERLLSLYIVPNTLGLEIEKIWIITEWDRSITNILLPSKY
jgi:hypothetical protein